MRDEWQGFVLAVPDELLPALCDGCSAERRLRLDDADPGGKLCVHQLYKCDGRHGRACSIEQEDVGAVEGTSSLRHLQSVCCMWVHG